MWEFSLQKLLLHGSQYVVYVTRVCRTRSASRLSRPGAGYPRSEGSGAKFEIYLGIATATRALRAELEDIQTQLCHRSLRVSVEFLAAQAHVHTATQSNSSHVVVYSRGLPVLHAKACTTPSRGAQVIARSCL